MKICIIWTSFGWSLQHMLLDWVKESNKRSNLWKLGLGWKLSGMGLCIFWVCNMKNYILYTPPSFTLMYGESANFFHVLYEANLIFATLTLAFLLLIFIFSYFRTIRILSSAFGLVLIYFADYETLAFSRVGAEFFRQNI